MFKLAANVFADTPSCLKTVSNYDLAQEVFVRLTSSGPSTSSATVVNYICDRQYLYLIMTSANGKEFKDYINVNTPEYCLTVAAELNQYKNKVYDVSVAAICDRQYLYRVKLTTEPKFTKDYISTASESDCRTQASQLNKN
jgi:hypothetical protein